jgi:serine/threonine protein kinase
MSSFGGLEGAILDGKYRVGGLLGRGGMGAVFSAEHLGTGRAVAIKVILPQLVRHPEALERFRREARAAGRLRHPNIVDVTDFGIARVGDNDIAYLVMEYLEGTTVRAFVDTHGRLHPEIVAAIVEQIALALDAAHAAAIVHRDVKPDNVWLIPDGRGGHVVRVLDFGLAKLRDVVPAPLVATAAIVPDAVAAVAVADAESDPEWDATLAFADVPTPAPDSSGAPLTVSGSTLGTPAYMSPEQCRGEIVDHRSDIYSLGVMTYEAIAGNRPFSGNFNELVDAHLHREPERLDRITGVSKKVADAVARAMAKSADQRYPSARAMAGSLYAAVEGPSVIVRRAIALYADRFPFFVRIAVHSFFAAFLLTVLPVAALALILPLPSVIMFGAIAYWGAMTMVTNAAFGVGIDRLRMAPLEPFTVSELFSDLKQRLGLARNAALLRMTMRLSKFYFTAELKSPSGAGDLGFLIALLEQRTPADAGVRCKLLKSVVKGSYDWIRGIILAALLVVPAVEGCVLFVVLHLCHLGHSGAVALLTASLLIPVNAIFLNPIFSTALALLYFRSRQANGEDVGLGSVIAARV